HPHAERELALGPVLRHGRGAGRGPAGVPAALQRAVADRTPQLPNARAGPARSRGIDVGGRMTAHTEPVGTGPGDGQDVASLIRIWTGPFVGWDNLRDGPGRPRHAARGRPRTASSPSPEPVQARPIRTRPTGDPAHLQPRGGRWARRSILTARPARTLR